MEATVETPVPTSWEPSSGAAADIPGQPKRHTLTEQLLLECERRRLEAQVCTHLLVACHMMFLVRGELRAAETELAAWDCLGSPFVTCI